MKTDGYYVVHDNYHTILSFWRGILRTKCVVQHFAADDRHVIFSTDIFLTKNFQKNY